MMAFSSAIINGRKIVKRRIAKIIRLDGNGLGGRHLLVFNKYYLSAIKRSDRLAFGNKLDNHYN